MLHNSVTTVVSRFIQFSHCIYFNDIRADSNDSLSYLHIGQIILIKQITHVFHQVAGVSFIDFHDNG